MRILSQSEFKRLEAKTDIPIDMAQEYFPIQLRAFGVKDGERVSGRYEALSKEDLKNVLQGLCRIVDLKRAYTTYKSKEGSTYSEDIAKEFEWETFSVGKAASRNHACTLVRMFPVQNLLFSEQLKELGIQQRPGYLYFGAEVFRSNSWGAFDLRGSRLQGEQSLYEWEREMRDAKEYDERELRQLKVEANRRSSQSEAKGGSKKKKGVSEETEIEFERRVDKIPPWQGEIADFAHATNSRVLLHKSINDGYQYILETPMEFPKGFVRETAMILKRRWNATSKLVDQFCDLAFAKPTNANIQNLPAEVEQHFPQGEQQLVGPDGWWRQSSNPWFVQTVLLARLIGGSFWQYALGNLEQNQPVGIEPFEF